MDDDAPVQSRAGRADFVAIFRAEYGFVCNSLRRAGVREADVPDAAHDVFVTFHRKLAEFDTDRPVRAFLFGIAFRVAADHRKRAHRRYEVLAGEASPEGRTSDVPADPVEAREVRARVLAALDEVDEERRPVLVMHDIGELTMPEIAHALGINVNTAYSRLRLARADFTRAFRALGGRRD